MIDLWNRQEQTALSLIWSMNTALLMHKALHNIYSVYPHCMKPCEDPNNALLIIDEKLRLSNRVLLKWRNWHRWIEGEVQGPTSALTNVVSHWPTRPGCVSQQSLAFIRAFLRKHAQDSAAYNSSILVFMDVAQISSTGPVLGLPDPSLEPLPHVRTINKCVWGKWLLGAPLSWGISPQTGKKREINTLCQGGDWFLGKTLWLKTNSTIEALLID